MIGVMASMALHAYRSIFFCGRSFQLQLPFRFCCTQLGFGLIVVSDTFDEAHDFELQLSLRIFFSEAADISAHVRSDSWYWTLFVPFMINFGTHTAIPPLSDYEDPGPITESYVDFCIVPTCMAG